MAALNTQQEAHLRRRPSLLASMATIFALTIISASVYALLVVAPASDAATPRVLAIRFGPDLEVNPLTKDYLDHQLSDAEKHYDAVVIELDTPGGLSNSLRSIYQKELSLKSPPVDGALMEQSGRKHGQMTAKARAARAARSLAKRRLELHPVADNPRW